MSGPKKPDAVFRVGTPAILVLPTVYKGRSTEYLLVDVIAAKRTYVTVRLVDQDQRLSSDKTDYHMQTGQVRNRDKYGSYAPHLITVAEHTINERERAARQYLDANGINASELRGFWKDQGFIKLSNVLRSAEGFTKRVEGGNGS